MIICKLKCSVDKIETSLRCLDVHIESYRVKLPVEANYLCIMPFLIVYSNIS